MIVGKYHETLNQVPPLRVPAVVAVPGQDRRGRLLLPVAEGRRVPELVQGRVDQPLPGAAALLVLVRLVQILLLLAPVPHPAPSDLVLRLVRLRVAKLPGVKVVVLLPPPALQVAAIAADVERVGGGGGHDLAVGPLVSEVQEEGVHDGVAVQVQGCGEDNSVFFCGKL